MFQSIRSSCSSSHVQNKQDETVAWRATPNHPLYSKASSPRLHHPLPRIPKAQLDIPMRTALPRITNPPPPMRMSDHNVYAPTPHLIRYHLRRCNTPMRTRVTRSLYRSNLVSSVEVVRYGGDGFVTTISQISPPHATCLVQKNGVMGHMEVWRWITHISPIAARLPSINCCTCGLTPEYLSHISRGGARHLWQYNVIRAGRLEGTCCCISCASAFG